MKLPVTSVALALSLTMVLAASPARAEDAASQAAAQALFEDARKLASVGKYADACPKFAESERLDPGAGTLMNLADCYEKNGQTASAWVTFKDAAAAADVKHRADWAERARQRSAVLEGKLSRLTIDVPAASRADGMVLRRDGVEVGQAEWGLAIPTDPGEHTIEASAPGKKRWSSQVTVAPNGAQAHVALPALDDELRPVVAPLAPAPVPVVAAPPPAPLATSEPPHDGSSQRVAGAVVGGLGVAGVIVGSIFGVHAISENNDAKSLCPQSRCTSASGVQSNDDAKTAATISTVSMIAGVAAIGGGALLYFTAPKHAEKTGWNVSPQLGPGLAGVRIGGAW